MSENPITSIRARASTKKLLTDTTIQVQVDVGRKLTEEQTICFLCEYYTKSRGKKKK